MGASSLARIVKNPQGMRVRPNLWDYGKTVAAFSWQTAAQGLDGLPDGGSGGGLNIAHEAVDRHLAHGRGERVEDY